MIEVPQEILDLAVRRHLKNKRNHLVKCPLCGRDIGVGIYACNTCWLNNEDEIMEAISIHVIKTEIQLAMLDKLK